MLATCTSAGWAVTRVETQPAGNTVGPSGGSGPALVRVRLELHGPRSNSGLLAELDELGGVVEVRTEEVDDY